MSEKTTAKAAKTAKTTSKKDDKKDAEKVVKTTATKSTKTAKTAKTAKTPAVAKKETAKKSATTTTKITKTAAKTTTKKATKTETKSETKNEPKNKTNNINNINSSNLVPSTNIQRYVLQANEEYMNENQKNHFRQILNAQKRSLSSDIQNTMSSMQDTQTIYADPNDRASQETDMAIELRNRDRERKLIKKIDETLAAINRDDYGYCEECGEEIGISRLEARPTARLCIECKHLAELRERQMGK